MTKYAIFDSEGFPLGFYAEDVYGDKLRPIYGEEPNEDGTLPVIGEEPNPDCRIPAEAIEITDEQWMEIISHPGRRRWADGAVVPYEPPPPTLEEIRQKMPTLTARQFRLGLVAAGISPSTVTATIAGMPAGADRDKAQIEWEYATTFNRMHPLIATVGAALGLSDVQIDAMWTAAISL